MNINQELALGILHALEKAFGSTDVSTETIEASLELPPDSSMGDYAFPCFTLSRSLRKGPPQIAQLLADNWQ